MAAIETLLQAFDTAAGEPQREPDAVAQARRAARAALLAAGMPTRHTEDWKYTSLRLLDAMALAASAPCAPSAARDLQGAGVFDDAACARVVFVDGRVHPGLSRLHGLPAQATLAPWSAVGMAQQAASALVAAAPGDAFDAINRMFARDGLDLALGPGVRLAAPVLVVAVQTREGGSHLRHRVRLASGASAQIVEQHVALGRVAPYLATSVTQVEQEPGSALAHVRLQDEGGAAVHVSHLRVRQGEGSRLDAQALVLGAALSRQEIHVDHAGAGCATELRAASLLRGEQHGDVHVHIAHRHARGTSRTHARGVFDDAAHGVFTGRIDVHPGAAKTDAAMINRNLLLSPRAEVDTRPQLQIDADDVLCSHGTAVGKLDEDALFYLVARGIEPAQARAMLVQAFITQALPDIGWAALRAHVQAQLATRWSLAPDLEGAAS